MINRVTIIGNLGADPDSRTTNSGSTVCSLNVATNERVKDGNDWKDHTEWHKVTCFGKTAENVAKYTSKGSQVYVEGKLRTEKWTDKNGTERWTTKILADVVRFLGGKGGGSNRDSRDDSGGYDSSNSGGGSSYDNDIPF